MIGFGQIGRVKPEMAEEYCRLHAAVWPAVLETIHNCNMRNYSIFLHGTLLFNYFEYVGTGSSADMERMAQDPAYDEVKRFIAQTKKASTSAIQRRFGFGYNRAARIIDMLEQEGAIGPVNGSKPREEYISDNDH